MQSQLIQKTGIREVWELVCWIITDPNYQIVVGCNLGWTKPKPACPNQHENAIYAMHVRVRAKVLSSQIGQGYLNYV